MPSSSTSRVFRPNASFPARRCGCAWWSRRPACPAWRSRPLSAPRPGRYECILSLDAYQLAAGEYGFDLQTTQTNIVIDHNVESAVRFTVDACSPDGVAYNFRQDLGSGHLAMR